MQKRKKPRKYLGFVDLEKHLIGYQEKQSGGLGIEETVSSIVCTDRYMDARTAVRTVHGNSDNFEVKLTLSPLYFVTVMKAFQIVETL